MEPIGDAAPSAGAGRALVIHPALNRQRAGLRSPEARLAEACGLAEAIGLEVVHGDVLPLNRRRPATLLGKGQAATLKVAVKAEEIGVTIIDAALTPIQQRNLEKELDCKVIDRTGLILEIFGARARTREGQLQVELAALTYQRSRLVRSWTHLERQRGGFGFLGGPGESQLEIDRRLITDRIVRIKAELETVKRTRALHRKDRQRVPFPVVALVGYTNAGKSTLFNRLTRAKVEAADMLFATLDPTMRRLTLPSGRVIVLSDTVGFISDLPTDLVAAFRATLEEVRAADLILHVRDSAHPDARAQAADVEAVLESLDLGVDKINEMIEVLNKSDLLSAEALGPLSEKVRRNPRQALVSAVSGDGVEDLLARIDAWFAARESVVQVDVEISDGATIAWLYAQGEVLAREDDDEAAHMTVRLSPEALARFQRRSAGSLTHRRRAP